MLLVIFLSYRQRMSCFLFSWQALLIGFLHYGIMDHEALQKNMFGGGGANFNQFSLNLIPVCIWYIWFLFPNFKLHGLNGIWTSAIGTGCQELLQAPFPRRGGSSLQIRCRRKSVDLTDMGPSRSTRHSFFQQIYAKVELMIEKLGFIDKHMGNFWRYSLRLSGREFDMKGSFVDHGRVISRYFKSVFGNWDVEENTLPTASLLWPMSCSLCCTSWSKHVREVRSTPRIYSLSSFF